MELKELIGERNRERAKKSKRNENEDLGEKIVDEFEDLGDEVLDTYATGDIVDSWN